MIEIKNLSQTKTFDKLAILEVGLEKSGKSWCAATAPKPILIFDFDMRANALAGRADVYAITFREPAPHLQPTAYMDFLDILTKLEQGADLRDLGFDSVEKGIRPATIVPDSITTLARAINRYALYTNVDIRRRLTFGGKWQVDFVKNFDGWNAEMSGVESTILRCLAMPFHLVTTLHEEEEQAPDSSVEKKKFTGKIGPFPARYQLLFKYFNELWHFANMPDRKTPSNPIYVPTVQTKPDYRCPWTATNLNIDQYEQPDIGEMIKKHLSRTSAVK